MNPIVVLLAMAALILVGSALASSTEAAMLTVNPIQVHTLVQQRVPGSRALERIKARPGRALALLVVINNLFNIFFIHYDKPQQVFPVVFTFFRIRKVFAQDADHHAA